MCGVGIRDRKEGLFRAALRALELDDCYNLELQQIINQNSFIEV